MKHCARAQVKPWRRKPESKEACYFFFFFFFFFVAFLTAFFTAFLIAFFLPAKSCTSCSLMLPDKFFGRERSHDETRLADCACFRQEGANRQKKK